MKRIVRILIVAVPVLVILYCCYANYLEIDGEKEYEDVMISEVMCKNLTCISDCDGEYSDWVELYNPTNERISLKGYSLGDGSNEGNRWYFPNADIAPGEYLLVWMSGKDVVGSGGELHTSLCLDSTRETIRIYSPEDVLLDEMVVADMEWDISYGRGVHLNETEGYFSKATPGTENASVYVKNVDTDVAELGEVEFSVEGGFYQEAFLLELSCNQPDALIFFTTDGSEPTINSKVYEEPILVEDITDRPNRWATVPCVSTDANDVEYGIYNVDKCMTIRARVYKNGSWSEEISTQSYFIGVEYTLPVISIVAEPETLFNKVDGMYVPGETYWLANELELPYKYSCVSAFFGDTVEGSIEVWDVDWTKVFEDQITLSISGGISRAKEVQKGFIVECKEKNFIYKDRISSDTLKLKSVGGGSSYPSSYQNYFLSKVAAQWGVGEDVGDFYILFLDGEYWGIYYTQNRLSAAYISENKDIALDNLYVLESGMENTTYV